MLKYFIYGQSTKLPWASNCRFINHAKCHGEISSQYVFKLRHFSSNQVRITGNSSEASCAMPLYSRFFGTRSTNAFSNWSFCQSRDQNYAHALRLSCASRRGPKGFITRSRNFSRSQGSTNERNKSTAIYIIAVATVVLGGSYAAVPLYRMYCQASGLGGTVQQSEAGEKIKNMEAKKERLITVRFNADKSATMQWSFKPLQNEVKVYPGETALAFYTAKNPTDTAVTGISTYNVIPFEAGQYFNKIQVDMPVFFYIDPQFAEDPALYKTDTITLSYTFFQAKEAQNLVRPHDVSRKGQN